MDYLKNRVAIYCRLSEEDRNKQFDTDDSNSIQNQKSMLLRYAKEHDWSVYDIYSDDDYTGADRKRPAFTRMLADAERRKFDIILCKSQSRFTRELELVEKYIHGLFPIWGIRFVSIVDNADTDNKGNKKSRQINGMVNEWYLEDMSENIKSVLVDRRRKGLHIGAFALYGYKKDPNQKGHLVIDEEAAEVVREVFNLYAQGYGKTTIARMLNDRGIPNPTEYKRLHGLRYKQPEQKNSTLWKYFAISDMLVNEIYIGNMVQGKYGSISYKTKQNKPRPKETWYRVEGTHEPIIDMELWNRVQKMVQQKTKPFSVGTIGVFAKKAFCMNCGYTMRSSKNHGYHYLKCSNRHVSKDSCIGSFIPVRELEDIILRELRRLSEQYLDIDELEQKVVFLNDMTNKKEKLEEEISSYQKRVKECTDYIRELYLDKVKRIITESDYLEFSKDFTKEKERLEKIIVERQKKLEEIEQKIAVGDNRRELLEQYINLEHLDRTTVDILVDHIEVGKRDPETKEVPVKIYWNF